MNAPYKIIACTSQHIGDRKEQQDRLVLQAHARHPGTVLAVVADGMGGRSGGGIAAEQVVNTAVQLFQRLQVGESVEELLTQTVMESHTVIRLLSLSEEKEPHSTLISLVITPTAFHWAHVGDSRMYWFRHGVLKDLTNDHSFVNEAIASGHLTPEQAATHPQRNMLTSALGMTVTPKFTLGKLDTPRPGDIFILASDGLWAYFKSAELGKILSSMNPKEASKLLMELARERSRGRGDNLSFIVIKLATPDSGETVFNTSSE